MVNSLLGWITIKNLFESPGSFAFSSGKIHPPGKFKSHFSESQRKEDPSAEKSKSDIKKFDQHGVFQTV